MMTQFLKFMYNFIGVPFMYVFFFIFARFNSKVRRGLAERKKIFENLIINLTDIDKSKKKVWFHSASMGEFEQAKPIIEHLKKEVDINIVATFFSPSGYDNSIRYPYADIISYLPFDFPGTVRRFIRIIKPDLVIFMRYDLWPNVVWQLRSFKVPIFLVDATLRIRKRKRLPGAKAAYRAIYREIGKILSVSEKDRKNFIDFGVDPNKCIAVGDTRFDRVYEKSLEAKTAKLFPENFFEGKKTFVCGSTWASDEDVILPAIIKLNKYEKNLVTILVPHEPTVSQLERIENRLFGETTYIRFSRLQSYNNEKIIIVDTIGILLTLYYYADAAYVGGSFRQGIHNVLEPAVYGIPVLYGPKHENSREALELVELGGGIKITNKKSAYRFIRKIFADDSYKIHLGKICENYVRGHLGATSKIDYEILKIL